MIAWFSPPLFLVSVTVAFGCFCLEIIFPRDICRIFWKGGKNNSRNFWNLRGNKFLEIQKWMKQKNASFSMRSIKSGFGIRKKWGLHL